MRADPTPSKYLAFAVTYRAIGAAYTLYGRYKPPRLASSGVMDETDSPGTARIACQRDAALPRVGRCKAARNAQMQTTETPFPARRITAAVTASLP